MLLKTIIVIIYFLASIIAFAYSIVGNRKPAKTQNMSFTITWRYLLNIVGFILLATAVLATMKSASSIVFIPLMAYFIIGLPFAVVIATEEFDEPKDIIINRFIRTVSCISLVSLFFCTTYPVLF